jgi:hypothetical protein
MIPILSSLALTALLASAPCELPCRCMAPPPPAQARDSSAAVFVGRVISQRDSVWLFRDTINDRQLTFDAREHTLVVEAGWKLPAGASDTIRVWTGNTRCDGHLELDRTFLVYASESRFYPGLVIFGCGRTRYVEGASDDITALGTPIRGALPAAGYPPAPAAATAGRSPDTHPHR